MEVVKINSKDNLTNKLNGLDLAYVLIYKDGSEISQCALKNLENASLSIDGPNSIFAVDVNEVKDIHINYGVTSAPSLLIFKEGVYWNVIKGCMGESYYSGLFNGNFSKSNSVDNGKSAKKRVIVYSTPTCSWCTKIKDHLKANNIDYREIDVAADPRMAEEMKRKSGQMGVPQTEINGRMIVGFDRPKIDKLLEIA